MDYPRPNFYGSALTLSLLASTTCSGFLSLVADEYLLIASVPFLFAQGPSALTTADAINYAPADRYIWVITDEDNIYAVVKTISGTGTVRAHPVRAR